MSFFHSKRVQQTKRLIETELVTEEIEKIKVKSEKHLNDNQ